MIKRMMHITVVRQYHKLKILMKPQKNQIN